MPDTSTLPPLRWDTLDAAAESSGRTAGEIRRDNGLTPDWVRSPSGYDQPAQPSDVEDESPPDEK